MKVHKNFISLLTLITVYSFSGLGIAGTDVDAKLFVDLQEGEQFFKGYRRAHAKGLCISGEFRSNGALSMYTKNRLFTRATTDFIGRFSIAGNNPHSNDLDAPVRSLALDFRISNNERWRLAMNTPPVMAVRNPEDFYEQLIAIKKGPEAIKEFFSQHPESNDFLAWKSKYKPASSFSEETYHSINAFYLHAENNEKYAVRWRFEPASSTDVPQIEGPDALQERLKAQLSKQAVIFNWWFVIADESDDEEDPTKKWPDEREQILVGKLYINGWQEQLEGECHEINFDPLVLPRGISATNDPILRARSAAYAESYRRRAYEVINGALDNE